MEMWAIEYKLVNATPEYVFDWLKNNTVEKHTIGDDKRDQLENSLLSRNKKLINLGLALYGEVPSIGYELFKSSDSTIKRATLSGRSVRPIFIEKSWLMNDDVIPVLLEEEKQSKQEDYDNGKTLLHELLNNKFIPDELLEAVYKKSEPFSDVDEKLWVNLVAMTARNERLTIPYNNTWMDGFDEYRYNAVFSAAWHLFKEFPVNKRAAHALSFLSDRLVTDIPHNMKILDVLDRWRSEDEKEDEVYSYVRTALVNIIDTHSTEFKELKNNGDLAIRKGYYANLSWAKPIDVTDGFDKDGKEFLDSALYNDSFFATEETREALSKACWDAPDKLSSMDYPNYFNVRAEYLSAKHPEWFKDSWSGELPFEEIEDAEERREKRLEYLNTQVTELHKALLGDKDEYQESNEFGENSMMNDLRQELQQIGEHLGKLYQKSSFSWGWLVAGVALGFILRSII